VRSPLRGLSAAISCLLALTFLTVVSQAQNVTTWHNDLNRTGWQQNETTLSPATISPTNAFGLLQQWPVTGYIYAQPLAVTLQQSVGSCANPCSLVFVATEQDMLYAFNTTSTGGYVWSLDLAGAVGGTAVDCSQNPTYGPCLPGQNPGPFYLGSIGVTGTPVIDTNASPQTLYVAAEVEKTGPSLLFYLFAVDITRGTVRGTPVQIAGTVAGKAPAQNCTTSTPAQGDTILFDQNHIQRSALLLLGSNVYVAFASAPPETANGWLFGYSFNGGTGTFAQTAVFNTTRDGTGGGIWQSGAGPASDGSSIFLATGNGTFDLEGTAPVDVDAGDTLLRLTPPIAPSLAFTISDYYTPSDVFTYPAGGSAGRCVNDIDFASGGVLLPTGYTYTDSATCVQPCSVVINADKESKLYVANQGHLGKYNSTGDQNLQIVQTPTLGADLTQGYWASPAYWHYTDSQNSIHYMLYYSATMETTASGVRPEAINAYQLQTSGSPIPSATPFATTSTLFCDFSPTPSVSSSGNTPTSGIVWAIETNQRLRNEGQQYPDCAGPPPQGSNGPPAALHAFCATAGDPNGPCPTALREIYTSRAVQRPIGKVSAFPIPTIFKGQVYMGTHAEVDVFGLCPQAGCIP